MVFWGCLVVDSTIRALIEAQHLLLRGFMELSPAEWCAALGFAALVQSDSLARHLVACLLFADGAATLAELHQEDTTPPDSSPKPPTPRWGGRLQSDPRFN